MHLHVPAITRNLQVFYDQPPLPQEVFNLKKKKNPKTGLPQNTPSTITQINNAQPDNTKPFASLHLLVPYINDSSSSYSNENPTVVGSAIWQAFNIFMVIRCLCYDFRYTETWLTYSANSQQVKALRAVNYLFMNVTIDVSNQAHVLYLLKSIIEKHDKEKALYDSFKIAAFDTMSVGAELQHQDMINQFHPDTIPITTKNRIVISWQNQDQNNQNNNHPSALGGGGGIRIK